MDYKQYVRNVIMKWRKKVKRIEANPRTISITSLSQIRNQLKSK